MAEKRKPDYVILLRNPSKSKTNKMEFFSYKQFVDCHRMDVQRWRLRLNGKWWPEGEKTFFTMTRIKELTFQSISKHIRN